MRTFEMREKEIKKAVMEGYAKIAKEAGSCCVSETPCCGNVDSEHEIDKKIGYTEEELRSVPEGADLDLGCGNRVALASVK